MNDHLTAGALYFLRPKALAKRCSLDEITVQVRVCVTYKPRGNLHFLTIQTNDSYLLYSRIRSLVHKKVKFRLNVNCYVKLHSVVQRNCILTFHFINQDSTSLSRFEKD